MEIESGGVLPGRPAVDAVVSAIGRAVPTRAASTWWVRERHLTDPPCIAVRPPYPKSGTLEVTLSLLFLVAACSTDAPDAAPPPEAPDGSSPDGFEGRVVRTHGWTTEPVSAGDDEASRRLVRVRSVQTSLHDRHDDVVVVLDGVEPGPRYHVGYLRGPVRDCGSGKPRALAGDATLEIRLDGAVGHTERGDPTFDVASVRTDGELVTDLARTCDFEGTVSLAVGVTREVPFRVQILDDPARLAVRLQVPSSAPGPRRAQCHLDSRHEELPTVALDYPRDWAVTDPDAEPCRYFDPRDRAIERESENPDVAIRAYVDAVPFATAAQPDPTLEETSRMTTMVDGHRAVRVTGTTTDRAMLPAGVERTVWTVDLTPPDAEDAAPGILVLSTHPFDDVDVRPVVDEMARTARIGPVPAVPESGAVVATFQGGGSPFTVRWADDCFTLHRGGQQVDEACGHDEDGPLSHSVLRDEQLRAVAGLTSDRVDLVRLQTNTDSRRAVIPVSLPGRVRLGYAMALSGTEASVIAETFDGEALGRQRVLPRP